MHTGTHAVTIRKVQLTISFMGGSFNYWYFQKKTFLKFVFCAVWY